MSEAGRVSSEFVIQAAIRRWQGDGGIATILHKGDAWGGAIILKLNLLDGASLLLTQTRDSQGRPAWLKVQEGSRMNESECGTYIERQLSRDPDLWVVEIEDREGRFPFEGKVL